MVDTTKKDVYKVVGQEFCKSGGQQIPLDVGVRVFEDQASVIFRVAVNDYPAHKDVNRSKNLMRVYVNMYTLRLNTARGGFQVTEVQTRETGSGPNPAARFLVKPNQIVSFEGFRSIDNAVKGAVKKRSTIWKAPPPYKNFSRGDNMLHQTNFLEIDKPLRNDWSYAGATSLSTPYIEP